MRTLLAIVMGLFAIVMSGYGYSYIILAQEADIVVMKTSLDAFEVDCHRYPSTAEGLAALSVRPESVPATVWHGPYWDKLPKDVWGHSYVYRSPGTHNTDAYDLYSFGVDGVSKSDGSDLDDINNWNKAKPWEAYYLHYYQMQELRSLGYKVAPVIILVGLSVWMYFKIRRRSRHGAA